MVKNSVEVAAQRGVDYKLGPFGDSLDWSLAGENEPTFGSTYYITLKYRTDSVEKEITKDRTGVTLYDENIVFGDCSVDYTHYLKRIDTIVLYTDGSISVIKGAPSENNPSPQNVEGGLVLSTVLIEYGKEPYFYRDYYRAVKMSDLFEIKNAISTLQANLAQLDLKTDISSKDPATTRSGMFVDPFYDDDQRDEGLTAETELNPDRAVAEIVNQTLYPHRDWIITTVHEGNDITLNRTETTVINQKFRTKSRVINEFSNTPTNPVAKISISPSIFRWTSDFTTVSQTVWKTFGTHKYGSYQGTSTTTQLVDINEVYSVPPFAVGVTGSLFNANENIKIYIDGVELPDIITTDSKGSFSVTVYTPSTMKSGTSQILAVGQISGARGVHNLTTTPQTEIKYITTYYERDPIGQTFLNEDLCMASSISVFFAVKPESEVTIALCETSSGYPDPTKIIGIAECDVSLSNISTTNWTKFTFASPIVLNANTYYAFIVISDENKGQLYCAELGKRDNYNEAWMTQNVFSSGTLVQASQLYTWSAIQSEDLTFKLDRCKFETGTSEILLGTVNLPSAVSELYLMADSDLFSDTSLSYEIALDGYAGTHSITEYEPLLLSSKYAGNINVKAKLTSSSKNGILSPKINGDIQLAGSIPFYPSEYISRAFATDNRFMKVYLDTKENGNQISVWYCKDGTTEWISLDIDNELYKPLALGNGWSTRIFFKDLGDYGKNKGLIRVKIVFNDSEYTDIPAARNLRVLTLPIE